MCESFSPFPFCATKFYFCLHFLGKHSSVKELKSWISFGIHLKKRVRVSQTLNYHVCQNEEVQLSEVLFFSEFMSEHNKWERHFVY